MEKLHPKKSYIYINTNYGIEQNVSIPCDDPVSELVHILMIKHNLPVYVVNELTEDLEHFIKERSTEYFNDESTNLINETRENKINLEEITKEWEKVLKEEMAEYGERRCASDDELFATAYHKMVHSPALETMLQLEHMYSKTVRQKTEEKKRSVQKLSEQQSQEMNNAVDRLEKDMTETKINELVARHYETHALLQAKLSSELDTLKEAQRREYREWLMQMLEQNQTNSSLPTPNSPLTPPEMPILSNNVEREQDVPILEESFTIHLGSQLKQMHNIRILSANVMDLCAVEDTKQSSEPKPQLLQTALALYSNDLSGLVLLADNKIGSRWTQEFQEICQKSTEFHFPHIEDQLDKISNIAQKYLKSDHKSESRNSNSELLQPGDFYITRHSNLAQVHVIFHMVSDDSLRGNDINSRHPVVLGLRNILKTACSNDITSLTIPLLLQYEMTEDMTISWCEKRAELVFKCVKGFMIEMASWGGSDLKNLQFMVPQGISSQVFQSLTEMLPRIFKVSNPKVLQ
ncbi:protein C12orf4 homolog [Diabrotica virgifera virgifera]|uniref:Protein C12orf4 homolog n=1 Tax=Diabrotica virgifera virgifera TaxID=50390 RepID=A0A6P7F6S2_DIAVI|nr:protein C12orf4 homolog [Diabrotica virgifera virgifera]